MRKIEENAVIKDGSVLVLKSDTKVLVRTSWLKEVTGLSEQWLGKFFRDNEVKKIKTPYGEMFELDTAMGVYFDWLEERAKSKELPEDIKSLDLQKAQAETSIKQSKAAIAELELKEVRGEMHRSEDVANVMQDFGYAVRGALLGLPGRLSVELAHVDEPAKVSEMIQTEVYKVLEDLKDYKYDPKVFEERVRSRRKLSGFDVSDNNDDSET